MEKKLDGEREISSEFGSRFGGVIAEQSRGRRVEGSRRRLAESPQGGTPHYHEEGGPLLVLMVASEHSASEESQSESPNCRGFS